MEAALPGMGATKPTELKSVAIIAMGSTAFSYFQDFESNGGKFTDKVWSINAAGVWWREHTDLLIHMDDLKRDEKRDKKYVERIIGTGLPILTCTKHDYLKAMDFPNEAVAFVNDFIFEYRWRRRNDNSAPGLDIVSLWCHRRTTPRATAMATEGDFLSHA